MDPLSNFVASTPVTSRNNIAKNSNLIILGRHFKIVLPANWISFTGLDKNVSRIVILKINKNLKMKILRFQKLTV